MISLNVVLAECIGKNTMRVGSRFTLMGHAEETQGLVVVEALFKTHGNFIVAFSARFDIGTNNNAELQALICGNQMCNDMGYHNICIELDFELVMGWLKKKICNSWNLWDIWKNLENKLLVITYTIKHLFTEEN